MNAFEATKQCGSFERGRMLKKDFHPNFYIETPFLPHRKHILTSFTKPNKIRPLTLPSSELLLSER